MRPRSRRGRIGKPVPLWIVLVLLVVLAAVVLVRLKIVKPVKPPVQKPAPVAKPEPAPPKAPAPRPEKPSPGPRPGPGPAPAPPPPPKPQPQPPPPLAPEAPRSVSIVLDDVGGNLELVQTAAKKLPKEVTFAVLPFLQYSQESARYLHERGFPVILHAPMEPEDSGHWRATPGTLLLGMPKGEVENIIELDLGSVPFAEGINNHMGSKATTDAVLMRDLAEVLKGHGLYLLDSRTTTGTVAFDEARAAGLPCAFRAVFLDDEDSERAILEQMDRLVTRSEQEGTLVAIGHLRQRTIDVLAKKIPYYRARGIRFLPLREVVR